MGLDIDLHKPWPVVLQEPQASQNPSYCFNPPFPPINDTKILMQHFKEHSIFLHQNQSEGKEIRVHLKYIFQMMKDISQKY